MPVTVQVKLNERSIQRELNERDGAVGRVLAGFSGTVTKQIKGEFKSRAGGAWWPVTSSISPTPRGLTLTTTIQKTKPHLIVANRAPTLVFFWERQSRTFRGDYVRHPGSSPPVELILSAIDRAGRYVAFSQSPYQVGL